MDNHAERPKPGIYIHYKGNRYELMGFATHSETLEEMAVYRALYGDHAVWVRPLSMWSEPVEVNGITVPRFRPEKEEIVEDMTFEPEIEDKYTLLHRVYGYDSFRPGQEEIIDSIVGGRDTVAILPTGGGKSICYQIPALLLEGISLIISPLISLMKDQVQSLRQNGVAAAFLNSSLTERQMSLAMQNMAQGKYKVIYVAPERLLTERFLSVVSNLNIAVVAVDEAHCISQWGQDFRPSYLEIPDFIERLPVRPTVCAFTATATERVRKDIRELLRLNRPFERVTGFDRANLFFSVEQPANKKKRLLSILSQHTHQAGIIYCATRKTVEALSSLLDEQGFSVTRYHAGLSDDERRENQDDFTFDRKEIMVATNAFGMGIDKSNVRYIVHYNMPKDIESYYQEAGRAGRDGESAECILLYGKDDVFTQEFFIKHMGEEANLSEEELATVQAAAKDRLNKMVGYCGTPDCLRAYILDYFGEKLAAPCEHCGNCTSGHKEDQTPLAQKVLDCVLETGGRYGASTICEILRGENTTHLNSMPWLSDCDSFGAASGVSAERIGVVIDRLFSLQALESRENQTPRGTFRSLRAGLYAEDVLYGRQRVEVLVRESVKAKKTPKITDDLSGDELALFEQLRELRKKIADSHGIPAFAVFSDATLRLMAKQKPRSLDEMSEVSGVGRVKLRDYGKRFLKEIEKFK